MLTAIGLALSGRYEVPQELPREMLALLMRLNAQHEEQDKSPEWAVLFVGTKQFPSASHPFLYRCPTQGQRPGLRG